MPMLSLMSIHWLWLLMHTKAEEKQHHLHYGSVIIGNNDQLSLFMFPARATIVALIKLWWISHKHVQYALPLPLLHGGTLLKEYTHIFTKELTVVTTYSHVNARMCILELWIPFSLVLFVLADICYDFWLSCTGIRGYISFSVSIQPRICPLLWSPGQSLGLSDLE